MSSQPQHLQASSLGVDPHFFISIYAVNQFDQCHYLCLHHSIAYDASGAKVQHHGSVEIEVFVMLLSQTDLPSY